jgi:hypothetical protein
MKMKTLLLVAVAGVSFTGCTMNSSNPVTAWGKQGVSMLDYRTDGGQCAVLAATATPESNAAKTAGGIYGQNGSAPTDAGRGSAGAGAGQAGGAGATSGTVSTNGGSGAYRDSASADFVQRAAMQQRTQEMALQRARSDALRMCLVERGYTEFQLTSEQRAQLAKLPQGSDERREYLYKLGTDPQVLSKAGASK